VSLEGICCICSRGLVFSKTIEATDVNMMEAPGDWFRVFTHDKPIPDAQNEIVEKALAYDPEWLWFVEEDIQPPVHALVEMLEWGRHYDVVTTRYRLKGGSQCGAESMGEVKFTGIGCTLIRQSVFSKMGKPYFFSGNVYDTDLKKVGVDPALYGQQDVYFFARLKECDVLFYVISDFSPDHLRVAEYGDIRNNVGYHRVEAI